MNLICGKMDKSESFSFRSFARSKIMAGPLQKSEGPHDIRMKKWSRLINRSIDMGFGGKVHNRNGFVPFQKFNHLPRIRYIPHHHLTSSAFLLRLQIGAMPSISQLI